MEDTRFVWISFYEELATSLLIYKNNRSDLLKILENIFKDAGLNYPFKEKGQENYEDICPFTVFGSFNKGIKDSNKIVLLKQFAKYFSITANVPEDFSGIPVLMNMSAWFFSYKENRGENDIDNLWELFDRAIQYSENPSIQIKNEFVSYYDQVIKQKMIKWNITMGLFWIRPYTFINLDSTNRSFITNVDNMPHYITKIFQNINKGLPNGSSYLFMCEQAKNALKDGEYEYHSFPELSYYAFNALKNENESSDNSSPDSDVKETAYWIYSPGSNASMWDEFYKDGIMALGWDEVKNLNEFLSKEEIKAYMKQTYDASYSYRNDALCLWQFAKQIKNGDVIFVKKGIHKLIGKGVVTSDYLYDASRKTYKHVRKVDWQFKGEWEHPDKAVTKTLTNITAYSDYVKKLLSLFEEETSEEDQKEIEITYPSYKMDPVKRTPEKTTDVGKTGFCITESFSFGKLFSWKDGITMGKNYFTDEQVRELEKNPYVISVTTKSVNYSEDFKELFLKDYNAGMTPINIFKKYGFDPYILGKERRKSFIKRIKMESQRLDGFKDMRKENSGRSKTKDMTPDEIIERLQHQNHVLRQENDFLKRVRSINRRQLSKMQKNKP